MRRVWPAAIVVMWLLAGTYGATEEVRRSIEPPTFRAATELVALAVTVTDSRSQYVPGLTADDFIVLENGVPQPLSYFAATDVPLDLTLLIDVSASMTGRLDEAREAVRGLVRSLRPEDRIEVFELRQNLTRLTALTSDRRIVERAIGGLRAEGMTALYTSMYVALSKLDNRQPDSPQIRREAVVLLSDGEDTVSALSAEDVLDKARRSGVTIYSVALRPPGVTALGYRPVGSLALAEADYVMRRIARDSGGQAFFPIEAHELALVYRAIAEELRQQYTLAYTPSGSGDESGWRTVRVNVPTRPNLQPRTRAGYFTSGGSLRMSLPEWWRGRLR